MKKTRYSSRQCGRCLTASLLVACVAVAGCSPPPPATSDTSMSVGMPGSDPGQLTDEPLAPPDLEDARFVQTQAAEIVPKPDAERPEEVARPEGVQAGKPDDKAKTNPDEIPELMDGPENYRTWDPPDVALVVTGNQHGYIEPCGCTGLDRQKGGVARRFTFMKQLSEKGWTLLPIDAGNQVRRFGRQAEVKLQQTVRALTEMDYQAIGFGPEDVRLGVGELLAVAAGEDDSMYVSSNVVLIDPSLMPQTKVVEKNGMKIGITSVLDPDALEVESGDEILVEPTAKAAEKGLAEILKSDADFNVLMFFGNEADGEELVRKVPGYDLLIVAGGYGEPTFQAMPIKSSSTRMIVTGHKGMYAGLVGLYAGGPIKYARVALTHEFADAPEMRQLMQDYQNQLRDIGLQGLGLLPPIPHASGRKFVGSAKCGECHTTAFEIWEGTPHAHATESLVKPPKERGDVARHFDPECLSCHVTGWNPQEYYPYESGYLSLEASAHLTGSGCENCHGPGAEHVAAEEQVTGVDEALRDELREAMVLPYDKARENCLKCHDLDNSPDFHEDDAFEDVYWPQVEHYGLD